MIFCNEVGSQSYKIWLCIYHFIVRNDSHCVMKIGHLLQMIYNYLPECDLFLRSLTLILNLLWFHYLLLVLWIGCVVAVDPDDGLSAGTTIVIIHFMHDTWHDVPVYCISV